MARPDRPRPPQWDGLRLVFALLGGGVLLFVVAPVAGMVLGTPPADLVATARDAEVQGSIAFTLGIAMAGTLLMALGAVPLAYLLARVDFPGRGLVEAAIDLPVVIPHSAAGIALLSVLSRNTAVGGAAHALGVPLVNSAWGTLLAMAFVSLPYLVDTARDGFAAVPLRLEDVARTLGASPARVFFTVSLPLAWRAVLTGLVLMWARGMSEFGAVVILAYRPMTAPTLIWERFGAYGLAWSRPVAALFVLVCLGVFALVRLLSGPREARRAGP